MLSLFEKPRTFWDKVDISPNETWCWFWLGNRDLGGYGVFSRRIQGTTLAHRLTYLEMIGPIPKDLQLDHKCRNRICVNPFHLEPVTARENVLRGNGLAATNARKTHCVHGHEFTPANTYWSSTNQRACRACKNNWRKVQPGYVPPPKKTHCGRGHEMVEANIYSYKGRTRCLECRHVQTRRSNVRIAAARKAARERVQ